jgi:hypothetical protein
MPGPRHEGICCACARAPRPVTAAHAVAHAKGATSYDIAKNITCSFRQNLVSLPYRSRIVIVNGPLYLFQLCLGTILVDNFGRPIIVDQLRQTAEGFAVAESKAAVLQTDNLQSDKLITVQTWHLGLST